MTKLRGKGFVISALVAGAASFLSKKENRDKTMKFINNMKNQASSLLGSKQLNGQTGQSLKEIAETPASANTTKIRENNFIGEGGGQTALAYYNESDQKPVH
ncbi:hypothetical protein [Lysinibacillus halotolerans]|uniref:Uncharacterized protein n=1 Tax=Lysinibacillus halotolerans TaxID=1368476 RepID=A0A3M8H0X5_9BACI|nr:hypothetical protein [Lysinibacillus halotolerans]RNC96122.1 hypothetical protein EC501_17885 [Lysinibacillus halotolerans]